jgi:citrate synthase
MVLTIDHGFANSTFATRVVASTGADLAACVVAGFASLSGPRHGADTERILDVFDAIGDPANAEDWLRSEMAARRRLQGFGHAVYRRSDPRLVLARELGAALAPERHRMAMAVEEAGTRLLAGRRLVPNIDLHAPVVVEACGVPRGWFLATFAAARIVGWCAHAIEQSSDTRILRPAARYIGPPPEIDGLYD